MKKIIAACLTVAAVSACGQFAVFAENGKSAEVYVTISDKSGKLAVSQEKITVTDVNNDGKLTIDDALYLAHENGYNGGANAGYRSSSTEFGTSLEMLWGTENGSGYGYYLNSKSAMSLDDEVNDGDFVDAYIYTDTENFSDTYTFFENRLIECKTNENVELRLFSAGFDENWQPTTSPVADAVIIIDGKESSYRTDENGIAKIAVDNSGEHIISAKYDAKIIVSPTCEVNASATEITEQKIEKSAETGNRSIINPAIVLCCLTSFIAIFAARKEKNAE